MKELNKIKELFNDFIKETDKIMKKQRVKQTITTEKTIYWGETAEKDMPWEDSRDWCEEKGGRLPTLEELEKAYKDGVSGFDPKCNYWSSTPLSTYAYYVKWSDCIRNGHNTDFAYSVRCVYDK